METVAKKSTSTSRAAANGTGRTRAYYGYSRNGCARCKQQRVRCDEQHPECDRCMRVGIQCPGYEQKLRWSAKHEVFRPEQIGQKKQQARRKQAQSMPATEETVLSGETVQSQAMSPQQQQQSQPQPTTQKQATTPRSHGSPSSSEGFQQPLPSPLGTGTATTQLTPNSGSPDSDTLFPRTSSTDAGADQINHPRNPSWLNLFDQLVPPASEYSDLYTGINNTFAAPQKTTGSAEMYSGNILASTELEGGGWANGIFTGIDIPMPAMMQANLGELGITMPELDDEVEYVARTQNFPSPQSGGVDMYRRGKWSHSLSNPPLSSSLGTPYTAEPADPDSDGESSTVAFGSGGSRSTDAIISSASKTLQPVHARSRRTTPLLSTTSINDFSTVFVEFYFKVTAQVFSCYDSRMNPFRTAVTKTWSSSRVMYCTLQSMAAASLMRDFPEVVPIGRQLRQEAAEILSKTKIWDVTSMLAVLMLGGTASWHNPKDLGLPFFNQIATCLTSAPASTFGPSGHRSYRFFRESMLYWEMLLAFVADNDTISTVPDERPDTTNRPAGPEAIPGPRTPHPWTGFCAETQLAVLKVGRLVRRQRKFDYSHQFASMAHIHQLEQDMATARELEDCLVNITHPTEQSVKDTEDRNTPVWHLLTLAEIIRDTGLVQLYHVFPDLLTARLKRERRGRDGASSHLEMSYEGNTSDEPAITQEDRSKWLISYTLRSLDRMKTLPIESGTRDFQPFLLVALSSELRVNKQRRSGSQRGAGGMGGNLPLHALLNLDMETVEVTRARGFIESRLTAFLHALPPTPILRCLDIVKETWAQMDKQVEARIRQGGSWLGSEDEADVYWMDVMIQNGLETIMA